MPFQQQQQTIQKCTKDSRRHFSEEDIQMTNKQVRRYSTSLSLEKNKSKPQWDNASDLLRWLLLKKKREVLVRLWRKGNSCTLLVGMWIASAIMKHTVEIFQKIKNKTTKWASNPTSGYVSKGREISVSKTELCSPVHCSLIHNSHETETA